jgi:HEAT repeat protein
LVNRNELNQLLAEAIVTADDASFEALAAAGPEAVGSFRASLAAESKLQLPLGRDREFIDNTTALSGPLARQFPDAYLAAFNSERWVDNSFVLVGLGYTGRAAAKPMLIQALRSRAPGVTRLSAAIALGYLPGADPVAALMKALDDEEHQVQYHSIRSLGQIGDRAALDRLLAIAADPANRGIAIGAPEAAARLARRLGMNIQVLADLEEHR